MNSYERWERWESVADESGFEPTESSEESDREGWDCFENTSRWDNRWDDPDWYEVPIPSLLPSEREARRRAAEQERIAQMRSDDGRAEAERTLMRWLLGLSPEADGPSTGPGGEAA